MQATGGSQSTETHPSDEDCHFAKYLRELRENLNSEANQERWNWFCNTLEQITTEAQEAVRLPPLQEGDRQVRQEDITDCSYIQKLYRRNRRRAIRLILHGGTPKCQIEAETVDDYFRKEWSTRQSDLRVYQTEPHQERRPMELGNFTNQEVVRRLRRSENTAPGGDRLTYRHWKTLDPDGILLTLIYNTCLKYKKIPPAWKTARTVLIFKKGDPNKIENYRPISLLRTIFKTYTGLLTARLTQWVQTNNALSHSQKGFMPHDGIHEHQYVLTRYMDEARRTRTGLCIAWLDLRNAFGSISHSAILAALESSRIGEHFTQIVADIYTGSTATVTTAHRATGSIPVLAGVRQGCPLSGMLFNLAINPLLEARNTEREPKNETLAFADDICIISPDPKTLQQRLNEISTLTERMGLHLNPEKSCTMHYSGSAPSGCRNTVFKICDRTLPILRTTETVKFLGKPVGFNILSDWSSLKTHMETTQKIMTSSLAPWQRIDAIKTFLYPSIQFSLRTGALDKSDWKKFDQFIRPMIKSTLNLPMRASNDYLYGARPMGCLGIPLATEDHDVVTVDGAYKLLTSPDPVIRVLANQHLKQTVKDRIGHDPTADQTGKYLSASQEEEFEATTNRLRNIWTRARVASQHLNCKWEMTGEPQITREDATIHPPQRNKICHTIRTQLRKAKTRTLHEAPHQGKVQEVVSLSRDSSHFLTTGLYVRFADWRFIHRARLGLVPLNMYRFNAGPKNCRRCNNGDESLPHVINHCSAHRRAILERHNAIVGRIKVAAEKKFRVIAENRTVIEGCMIRPDLLLVQQRTALILDVTVAFENRVQAFQEARARKMSHYIKLRENLLKTYDKAEIIPFVIGSLGSWDPENDNFVSRICSRTYAKTFRKLCVTDTIRFSRNIYTEHLTGVRQE